MRRDDLIALRRNQPEIIPYCMAHLPSDETDWQQIITADRHQKLNQLAGVGGIRGDQIERPRITSVFLPNSAVHLARRTHLRGESLRYSFIVFPTRERNPS